jgi:D-tyrosyl-tRNA(Tyr) deacylase
VGQIGQGVLVLLGVAAGDSEADADYLSDKITNLRIFEDAEGKMNLSLQDIAGEMLVVSQFTLYGDTRRGRRPSFIKAAQPADADRLYQYFVSAARRDITRVETGTFQAMMDVELINDGPVTLILDSEKSI